MCIHTQNVTVFQSPAKGKEKLLLLSWKVTFWCKSIIDTKDGNAKILSPEIQVHL